jgi:polar amino acid transport system substrate-binding protein
MVFRVLTLAILLCVSVLPAGAATQVRVGGYEFSPYVTIDSSMRAVGVTPDLLALLNKAQSEYEFVFVPTSPARRWADFDARKFDFLAFEDVRWLNKDDPNRAVASHVLQHSGDRYVALAAPGRDQSYFADLKSKRIAGVRGFHFGFAGGNADPEYQTQHFKMLYVSSGAAGLETVLLGRADVSVVSEAYVRNEMLAKPELKQKLLISDAYDVRYELSMPGRPGVQQPTMAWLNALLMRLEKEGEIDRLLGRYGVK